MSHIVPVCSQNIANFVPTHNLSKHTIEVGSKCPKIRNLQEGDLAQERMTKAPRSQKNRYIKSGENSSIVYSIISQNTLKVLVTRRGKFVYKIFVNVFCTYSNNTL